MESFFQLLNGLPIKPDSLSELGYFSPRADYATYKKHQK